MTVLTLDEAATREAREVGGKALGLARLVAIGLPVPGAVVVPAAAHAHWRGAGELDGRALDELWTTARALGEPLAVRSSAADEDAAARSAAGQYESVMNVRGREELAAAIERCYRAAHGERAFAYRGDEGEARLALVVQREVLPDRSGVAFSVDPVTRAREWIVVEAAFGHGEGIVSGEVTPDRFLVHRQSGEVHAKVADKPALSNGRGRLLPLPAERRLARSLRDHEARAVADLVIRAEAGFGVPVDVEFCLSRETIWLVQCRRITTLDVAA